MWQVIFRVSHSLKYIEKYKEIDTGHNKHNQYLHHVLVFCESSSLLNESLATLHMV